MSLTVTDNVTKVTATSGTTVEITESVTNVAVTGNTATLSVQPSETTVSVIGSSTSVSIDAQPQSISISTDSLGNTGSQTLSGNLTVTQQAVGAESIFIKGVNETTSYAQGTATDTKLFELQEHDGNPICFFGYIAPQIGGNNYFLSSPNVGLQFFKNIFDERFIQPISGTGTNLPDAVELGSTTNKFKSVNTQKVAFSQTKNITDFEFGTFTPNLPAVASNTLDYATGDYVKTQNLVTVNIDFKFTTAPSQMYGWIDNLPFTSATNTSSVAMGRRGSGNYFAGEIVTGYSRMFIRDTDGSPHTFTDDKYSIVITYKVA